MGGGGVMIYNYSDLYATLTQGKYGRRLYCDHVTKCFVSKCAIQVAIYSFAPSSCLSPNLNSCFDIPGTPRC